MTECLAYVRDTANGFATERRRLAPSAELHGRVTVKHDPDPSALSTVISPW